MSSKVAARRGAWQSASIASVLSEDGSPVGDPAPLAIAEQPSEIEEPPKAEGPPGAGPELTAHHSPLIAPPPELTEFQSTL